MKEFGVYVVKLEGGVEIQEFIKCILLVGVLVMGYFGFILQLIYKFGIYIVWAKEEVEVNKFIEDVKLLQELGCFVIVFEKILVKFVKWVIESIDIFIIGIGVGFDVSGQVLVFYDLLGIIKDFKLCFLRCYFNLFDEIKCVVEQYGDDVCFGNFFNEKEQYQ